MAIKGEMMDFKIQGNKAVGLIAIISLFLIMIIVLMILPIPAEAQTADSDEDTVLDAYDACPNTVRGDVLPIIKDDVEFVGCSCRQIAQILSEEESLDPDCVDYLCAPGEQLELEYRQFSREIVSCSPDYCINDTLFDFPEPGLPRCVDGAIRLYCAPLIEEGQQEKCKSLPKGPLEIKMNYTKKPAPWQNITPDNTTRPLPPPITPISEDKLEDEIYDAIYSEEWFRDLFKEGLDRRDFKEGVKKNSDSSIIRTLSDQTSEETSGKITPITNYYINVIPNLYKSYKNVLVFQRIPSEAGFDDSQIIFEEEPTYKIKGKLFVWYFKEMPKEGINIMYKANLKSNYQADTIIYADVSGKPILLQWWAPWLLVIAIIVGFYYWFKKQVKKHKK